jgi:hypothetical protein
MPRPELFQVVTIHSLVPPLRIHAYLDPGSGSFLLQLLIAGLVGFAFLFKGFWRKVAGLFTRKSQKKDDDDTSQQP